ncbi:hypothetical protein B0H66DRAFT_518523 [Apodospora peruviana]|uniref:NmrA-like domain-containing protein n=1 Tax=Apodospora peruviana TaxID=516989 RepID=A0AAE0M2V2_9PEZI|nr:hypothetical protein B0H66DRAFT_518523 [Apodospora peruviana]
MSTQEPLSDMSVKAILVTGATGKQGGAVVDALLDSNANHGTGYTILAVTRDASSTSAQRLAAKSPGVIELVQGNLDNVQALFEEARRVNDGYPIWGVYSVQVSLGPGVTRDSEIKQGTALIDASIAAGVKHFVYSSIERGGDDKSWDTQTPIPHFQSKYQIERHLRDATANGKSSMGWTILRPVAFMDNLAPGMPTKVFLAALRNYLGENDKKLQWVATSDIGVFVAKAFDNPEEWEGRAVGLAGDELTFDELSRAFTRVTGHPAPVSYGILGIVLTYLVKEMGLMIGWFASDGYGADIAACRREYPELLNMEQWLAKKSPFATAAK